MKYLERVYPYLLGAPSILPVIIWGGVMYPYLVPKTLFFYAVMFVTVGVFAILATHGRAFFWDRLTKWEAWIPGMLLVLAYLASIFGIDFYRSFWSLFVRGDGLLMLACVVTSFYLILLYANKTFFDWLLRAVAIIASFVALYGIGEWFIAGGRIGGLLGNAAFFAGYMDIAFFATLIVTQTLTKNWRRTAIACAVFQIISIVLTATRGTILALALAGIACLGYFIFSGEGKRRVWSAYALGALVVFGGLFFGFRTELAKFPFSPVARVASISFNDPDISSRLFIWKNIVGEIEKSPWLGVGAEHIDVLFNRFYDPTQINEQWFDRTHNAFLDYTVQYGIGGLVLYLALIAAFFSAAVCLARRGEKRVALLIALLAGTYAVQNFFVFDAISSFWLLLALLAVFLAGSFGDIPEEKISFPIWTRYFSWPFALILIILVIPISVRPALAAYDLAQAYKYQLTDVPKEVQYLSHGIALHTYGNLEYGYELYDMYANRQAGILTGQSRVDVYQSTLSILTANFNAYPYDARTALYLAHVLSLAPPQATIDNNLISAGLERAIRLSPKRSQPWYILANLSLSQANVYQPKSSERAAGYAAAEDILTRYIALVPSLSEPHFVMAQLLFASGDTVGAAAEAAKGKMFYQQSDLETANRAATYYENTLDLPNAAFFLAEIVRLDETNTAAANDLAKIQAYEQSKK